GSPLRAMTFSIPLAWYFMRICRISSLVDPVQVRWETIVRLVSFCNFTTSSCVSWRVDPPAPYVTLTYEGFNGVRSLMEEKRFFDASSFFGGKNSKLSEGWLSSNTFDMCIHCSNNI